MRAPGQPAAVAEQRSRWEAESSPHNRWIRSPEPCRVSWPAGRDMALPFSLFCLQTFQKDDQAASYLLRTADLAMGQGLCLVDFCVPRGLWTWLGARRATPGQRSAATEKLSPHSALPPHLCLSFLCQSRMMSMYASEIRNRGKIFFRKEKRNTDGNEK